MARSMTSGFRKTKEYANPYLASAWLYTALIVGFVTIYCWQMLYRATFADFSSKKKKWRSYEFMNSVWHKVVGVATVTTNPYWARIVEYEGDEKPKQALYMANHLSFADSLFLSGVLRHYITAVGKQELYDVPLFGSICKNNGMLPVAFVRDETTGKWSTDKESIRKMMAKAEEKVRFGSSICVFPEGKISITGELGPLKPGFFRLSLKTNLPIIPTGCWGHQNTWPMVQTKKGQTAPQALARPGLSYITCAEPMWPLEAIDFKNDSTLMSIVERCIEDDNTDLSAEDFEEKNWDVLGQAIFANAETSPVAEELLTAFIDKLIERVTEVLAVHVKKSQKKYEAKMDEYAQEQENFYETIEGALEKVM